MSSVFGRMVTPQSGDHNTAQVAENELYFTNARAQSAMSGLYQGPISLTTTGTSGPATFLGGTLNIPQYAGGGSMTWPASGGLAVYAGASAWGNSIAAGTTSQYMRGDFSLATFRTTWAWANLTGIPALTNTVFGRSGTVAPQSGDYTTAQVTESGNLYFTNARALAAVTWNTLTGIPAALVSGAYCYDTGVAAVANAWYHFRIIGAGTSYTFSFGADSNHLSNTQILTPGSSYVYSSDLEFGVSAQTDTAAARSFDIDLLQFIGKGLVR